MRTYSLTVPLEERTLTMRTYIAEKYHDKKATPQAQNRGVIMTNQKVMSLRFSAKNS